MLRIRSFFPRWSFKRKPTPQKVSFDDLLGFQRVRNVTMEEWFAMSDDLRRLLVEAAIRVDSERAASIGYASLGPQACGEVASRYDDGVLQRRVALHEAAYRAIQRD